MSLNEPSVPDRVRELAAAPWTAMADDLDLLVSTETPSEDLAACAAGADVVDALGERLLGERAERVVVDGRTHLRWRWSPGPSGRAVALIGHYDTVWPLGTLGRWPFSVDVGAGTATGPGCFDMKAGVVQMFHAVAALEDGAGVELLVTADEELGSLTSRSLVEEAGRRADAALVLEAAAAGAVKTGRKGAGMYRIEVTGLAAHAGLEPHLGANALVGLTHVVQALDALGRPDVGTTVTPTVARAGTATNVVPAFAVVEADVRVLDPAEWDRVDAAVRALEPVVPGTTLTVRGELNRPPLPVASSAPLFALATVLADGLGLPALESRVVGGASDGNLTAAVGCPTLDGLGAVGDGAHAEGEYVRLAAMPQRAALVAALVENLLLSR